MMKKIVCFVVFVMSATFTNAACRDFATQAEAQAYFKRTGDGRLDRDHDGIACEHLKSGHGKVKHAKKSKKSKKIKSAKHRHSGQAGNPFR